MNYKEINKKNRELMKSLESLPTIEWEDSNLCEILLGNLPNLIPTRYDNNSKTINKNIEHLKTLLEQYNPFKNNRENLLNQIYRTIDLIITEEPLWYGISKFSIYDSVKKQQSILISGEGGIGKSCFTFDLENQLENLNIPHLCIYGKFEKELNIEYKDLENWSKDGFVFIIDAINEMNPNGQKKLVELLKKIKINPKIRIILTYRTNTISDELVNQLNNLINSHYKFKGVSFESAQQMLSNLKNPNIQRYESIIMTNNPFQINLLFQYLNNKKVNEEEMNSIETINYLYENYIKKLIKSHHFKNYKIDGRDFWIKIKNITKYMFENRLKEISSDEILQICDKNINYIKLLLETGIMIEIGENNTFIFSIDSIYDFLIGRYLTQELDDKKTTSEKINFLNEILKEFQNEEIIILALFDKFKNNFRILVKILKKLNLYIPIDLIPKIIFSKESLEKFNEFFIVDNPIELFKEVGGYLNKPFNCKNYFNNYFLDQRCQLINLSNELSGFHFYGDLKLKLKNFIYLVIFNSDNYDLDEIFYFSIWCSASPNVEVRLLATKLLYEILNNNEKYIENLIKFYNNIYDLYIKETIINVLSQFSDNNEIKNFFNELIENETELTSNSIKRIAVFKKKDYDYINWNRPNILNFDLDEEITEVFNRFLINVDIINKDFLPFRYYSKDNNHIFDQFILTNKDKISKFNYNLNNLKLSFESNVYEEFFARFERLNIFKKIPKALYFSNLEKIFRNKITEYQIDFDNFEEKKEIFNPDEFNNSLIKKCLDISVGLFYGSLMTNYYTSNFNHLENLQNKAGFEVFDPFPFGEDNNINCPAPIYDIQSKKIENIILKNLKITEKSTTTWFHEIESIRSNLVELTNVFYDNKGIGWVILSAEVYLNGQNFNPWQENYNFYCCTSSEINLNEYTKPRYLTIELDEFSGNLNDYRNNKNKKNLCQRIKSFSSLNILKSPYLIVPPSNLIRKLNLHFSFKDLTWRDKENNIVIISGNTEYSNEEIFLGTNFIKKEYLDKFLETNDLKYFCYSEKYEKDRNWSFQVEKHYQIENHKIIQEIKNTGEI